DPTVQNPLINFTAAGTYQVVLQVTRPDDLASSAIANASISVSQQPANLLVTENPNNSPLEQLLVPDRFPGSSTPVSVGTSQSDAYFVATAYDQFGNKMP